MTVEATREKIGRFGRRPRQGGTTTLPIGEADANIFNCPACARPLGAGVSRCPGCGTRLLAGVQLGRAVSFIGAGLVVGMLVGGTVIGAMGVGRRTVDLPVVAPPVNHPSAAPIASSGAPIVVPGVPTSALSALRQSATLNQRVLADADRLALALATPGASGKEIAPILRNLASTASFGRGIAVDVGEWDAGADVSNGLAGFYDQIGTVARDGLTASVSNRSAYVAAARAVLKTVAGLPALDAASRTLAAEAQVELPPVLTETQAP